MSLEHPQPSHHPGNGFRRLRDEPPQPLPPRGSSSGPPSPGMRRRRKRLTTITNIGGGCAWASRSRSPRPAPRRSPFCRRSLPSQSTRAQPSLRGGPRSRRAAGPGRDGKGTSLPQDARGRRRTLGWVALGEARSPPRPRSASSPPAAGAGSPAGLLYRGCREGRWFRGWPRGGRQSAGGRGRSAARCWLRPRGGGGTRGAAAPGRLRAGRSAPCPRSAARGGLRGEVTPGNDSAHAFGRAQRAAAPCWPVRCRRFQCLLIAAPEKACAELSYCFLITACERAVRRLCGAELLLVLSAPGVVSDCWLRVKGCVGELQGQILVTPELYLEIKKVNFA